MIRFDLFRTVNIFIRYNLIFYFLLFLSPVHAQTNYYEQAQSEKNSIKKIELLNKAININATNDAYFDRAWANADLRRLNSALKDFKLAAETKGNKALTDIYSGTSHVLNLLGKHNLAIDYANKSLSENSGNIFANYLRASANYNLKKYDETIKDIDIYIKTINDRSHPYYLRHLAFYSMGKYSEALSDIEKAIKYEAEEKHYVERKIMTLNKLGRNKEADELLSKKISFDENDPTSLYNHGIAYFEMGDFDRAVDIQLKARNILATRNKVNPHYKEQNIELTYNCLLALGNAYQSKDEYLIALKYFTEATNLMPNQFIAWNALGNLQCSYLQNWEVAANCYEKSFSINPKHPEGWVNYGYSLSRMGKDWEAIKVYERANDLDSVESRGLILNNLGFTYLEQRKFSKSYEILNKAIQVEPDLAMSHISLGEYFVEVKKYDEAIEKFNEALSLQNINERESSVAYFKRGVAYHENKIPDKAKLDYQKSLEIDDSYTEAYEKLGILYFEANELCEAYTHFQSARNLDKLRKEHRAKLSLRYTLKISSVKKYPCGE